MWIKLQLRAFVGRDFGNYKEAVASLTERVLERLVQLSYGLCFLTETVLVDSRTALLVKLFYFASPKAINRTCCAFSSITYTTKLVKTFVYYSFRAL